MGKVKLKSKVLRDNEWEIISDDIPMAQDGIRVQNLSPLEKDSLDLYNYTLLQKKNEGYKSVTKKNNSGLDYFVNKIFGGNELNKGWLSNSKFDNSKQQSLEILNDKNLQKNRLIDEEGIYNKNTYKHNKTLPEVRSSNQILWERADFLVKNNPNIAFTNYSNSPDIQHRTIEPIGMYYGIAGNYEFPKPSFYDNLEKPVMIDSPSNPPANGIGFKRQISQIPKPKEKVVPPDTLKVPQYTKIVGGKRIPITQEEYNKRTKGQEAKPTGYKLDSQGKVLQFKKHGGDIKDNITKINGEWYNQDIIDGLDRDERVTNIQENKYLNSFGVSNREEFYQKFPTEELYNFEIGRKKANHFGINKRFIQDDEIMMQEGGEIKNPINEFRPKFTNSNESIQRDIYKNANAKQKQAIELQPVEITARRTNPLGFAGQSLKSQQTNPANVPASQVAGSIFSFIPEAFHTPSRVVNYGIGAYKNKDLRFNPYQSEISETLGWQNNDPSDLWASTRNFFVDNATDFLVPAEGIGNIGSKVIPEIGNVAKTGLREGVDLVHPVGRRLKQIEQEGISQGLSAQAIKNRQMQEVGITSLQREGYFPGVSEVLSEYFVPYSYDNAKKRLLDIPKKIIKGDTNTKRLADLNKVILDQGENTLAKPRYDAWRMYSGLPQRHGTFRIAETTPINHPSYTQNQLNNLEKFSLNDEKRLLSQLPNEYDYFRFVYNDEDLLNNVNYLKEQLKDINTLQQKGIDFPQSDFTTTNVMGGYNRRFFNNKMEYNDTWDLDLNGLKVDKYFGKPFMSHGQLEYSFEPAKKSINNLLRKAELLDNNINIFKGKSKYNFDDIKLNNYINTNPTDFATPKKQTGGKIKTDTQGYWNKDNVIVKPSNIEGKGLFSNKSLKPNEFIGLAHIDSQPVGDIGNYHNHSEKPNAESILIGNKRFIKPKRKIKKGEEITVDYRLQPELEQPEDFQFDGNSVLEFPIMQQGGQVRQPIRGTREQYQAYQDSLNSYNATKQYENVFPIVSNEESDKITKLKTTPNHLGIMPIGWFKKPDLSFSPYYKKPVQPIIYEPENERIPFAKGTYFSRERQNQELDFKQFGRKGKKDYFDKKTGKLLGTYKNGGKINNTDWEII